MERDNNLFFDCSHLQETPGIRERVSTDWIQRALNDPSIHVISATLNETGIYRRSFGNITGLPPFADIRLRHRTGRREENIIIWVPLTWNDRFMGTGGGGTGTGGEQYILRPDNTSRGQTLPKALLNGFACASTDAGNEKKQWAVENGCFDWERYENWRSRSTHKMSLIGRRVTELLHERPVQYSYFHGGSGGGRQALVEVQEWPEDYDGVWASCPAIHWPKFLVEGYWALAVMNDMHHTLSAKKLLQATKAVHDSVGGEDAYYRLQNRVSFDPFQLVGRAGFTEKDAQVIQALWEGPRRANGDFLWYGFRPGVPFWNVGIPIGAFYYQLFTGRPRPFFLSRHHLCWVTENERFRSYDMSRADYERLFERSVEKFASSMADKADLSAYRVRGGKLLIDHGTADPLIPVDGTLDYWHRVENKDEFLRLYITPGDGHGNCRWYGPGLTEATGMRALMDWVEHGAVPEMLSTLRVNRKGEVMEQSSIEAYCGRY